MSDRDPPRLLDPGSEIDPSLRALLAAGRAELPSPDQLAALARRAGPQFVAPGAKSALSGAGFGSMLSLVTLGLTLAGLGGAAYLVATRVREDRVPASHVPSSRDRGAASVRSSDALPVARTAEPRLTPAPPTSASPGLEPPVRPAPARSTRARAGIAATSDPVAELTLLDEAQAALHSAPELALDRATAHAARFPRGQYEQEREIIAIESLLQLGRYGAAERRAARFIARFPASSYRMRAEQQHAQASERGSANREPQ